MRRGQIDELLDQTSHWPTTSNALNIKDLAVICFISLRGFTGGPLAIHQAAAKIRDLGGQAGMIYIRNSKSRSAFKFQSGAIAGNLNYFGRKRISNELRSYGFPTNQEFSIHDHFVVPEAFPELAFQLLQVGCRKVSIWWLSVDNFPLQQLNTLQSQSLLKRCGHLCQSVYAFDFVKRHGGQNISMLSDEIDLSVPREIPQTQNRKIDFCYLPNKAIGADEILEDLSRQFTIKPLKGLSRAQIKETLLDSKIFLDFGHHPGKDRVPREAALCGAIPVVRREGAARFKADVPLIDELLIETHDFFDAVQIAEKLQYIIKNSEKFGGALEDYVKSILGEAGIFETEVRTLINCS